MHYKSYKDVSVNCLICVGSLHYFHIVEVSSIISYIANGVFWIKLPAICSHLAGESLPLSTPIQRRNFYCTVEEHWNVDSKLLSPSVSEPCSYGAGNSHSLCVNPSSSKRIPIIRCRSVFIIQYTNPFRVYLNANCSALDLVQYEWIQKIICPSDRASLVSMRFRILHFRSMRIWDPVFW